MKVWKFITNAVFLFFVSGCALVIVGQTLYLHQLFPYYVSETTPLHTIIKSIGAALIGSGVFTAIIKSDQYSKIFSDIIGEIIWSKKFIAKRGDKKEIWSMVSKLMYNEKFPAISDEIEEIITDYYFPTSHNFYIENYDIIINVSSIEDNQNFWKQQETINLTVKPTNANETINYKIGGGIDLPSDGSFADISEFITDSITVNGTLISTSIQPPQTLKNQLVQFVEFPLVNEMEYKVVIKRSKIVCKKTNPDKRFFALYITKGFKITAITDTSSVIDFHKMGTIKEFEKSDEQVNNNIKVVSWSYNGIILPQQGCIMVFK